MRMADAQRPKMVRPFARRIASKYKYIYNRQGDMGPGKPGKRGPVGYATRFRVTNGCAGLLYL